jgi:hypothetical protein
MRPTKLEQSADPPGWYTDGRSVVYVTSAGHPHVMSGPGIPAGQPCLLLVFTAAEDGFRRLDPATANWTEEERKTMMILARMLEWQ